jgi:hypothetical protein
VRTGEKSGHLRFWGSYSMYYENDKSYFTVRFSHAQFFQLAPSCFFFNFAPTSLRTVTVQQLGVLESGIGSFLIPF